MMRRSSIWKRLQRLEEVRQQRAGRLLPMAVVEMADDICAETHIVILRDEAGHGYFKEMPGPGPQIADFGEFDPVIYLTPDEMNL